MTTTKDAPKAPKPPKKRKKAPDEREELRRAFYAAIDAGELDVRQGIKRFREMLGMNQREFAVYVGIAPRLVMSFEQGRGNPTLKTLAKMLKGSGLELRLARKRKGSALGQT